MSVPLSNMVEEAHGMVLDHDVVRGEGFSGLIDPALDNLTAAL